MKKAYLVCVSLVGKQKVATIKGIVIAIDQQDAVLTAKEEISNLELVKSGEVIFKLQYAKIVSQDFFFISKTEVEKAASEVK